MSFRFSNLSVILVVAMFLTGNLFAHNPGYSTTTLTVGMDRVEALVTMSRGEVEHLLSRSQFPNLDSVARRVLQVGNSQPINLEITMDAENDFIFHLSFSEPNLERLEIRSPLIAELNPGHRQYLLVRDSRHELLLSKLLKCDDNSTTVESFLAAPPNESEEGKIRFGIRVFLVLSAFVGFVVLAMILLWAAMRFRSIIGGRRITVSIMAAFLFSPVLSGSSNSSVPGDQPPSVLTGTSVWE